MLNIDGPTPFWQRCCSGARSGRHAFRRGTVPALLKAQSGAAALEFAIIVPFLVLLMLGGFELIRYIKTVRKIVNASSSIGEMIAQNTTGSINDTDLRFFTDSIMLTFPDNLSDSYSRGVSWWSNIQISMSSIAFTATPAGCTSNCGYTAKVIWNSGPHGRPCSTLLTPVANGNVPTPTTLPADSFGQGSLIAVDLSYTYRPVVATNIFGDLTIARSFFVQPRYVSQINYAQSSSGMASSCS